MLKTIFIWVGVAIVILLIVFWFLGGGVDKVINDAESMNFSLGGLISGSSTPLFSLPWAPSMYPAIPTVPGSEYGGEAQSSGAPSQPTTFDGTSPYSGEITISEGTAPTQEADSEYIILRSSSDQTISLSGWSLQSALSGVRAFIPEAAQPFYSGRVNVVAPIDIPPEGEVIVVSGDSPVGVSFQENSCTGYLGSLQRFVPVLPDACPSPSEMLPNNAENQEQLGAACMDYVSSIPPCTFPANPPNTLSGACVTALQNVLSYNGCVNEYQGASGFTQNVWYAYLGEEAPLWNSQHDVIRLLDENGEVVSALTY